VFQHVVSMRREVTRAWTIAYPLNEVIVHQPLQRVSYARAHVSGDSRKSHKFSPKNDFFFFFF